MTTAGRTWDFDVRPLDPAGPVEMQRRLQRRRGAVLLESGLDVGGMGRFHIAAAEPVGSFIGRGDRGTTIRWRDGRADSSRWSGNPWDELETWWSSWRGACDREADARREALDLPFSIGAIGYLGFELGESLERYSPRTRAVAPGFVTTGLDGPPDVHFEWYDHVVIVEAATGRCWIAGDRAAIDRSWWLRDVVDDDSSASATGIEKSPLGPCRTSLSDEAFLDGVREIQQRIRDGRVYEVNWTRTHVWDGGPDPWSLHAKLRDAQPVPYGAVLDWSPVAVVSASPERFVRLRGHDVETRPIKGTVPRSPDRSVEADAARSAELLADPKQRAELAMIVDLERNDLNRVCVPGSVEVVTDEAVEAYATVLHTVATVRGLLEDATSPFPLLRSTFPGGSITGAPKIAAIETIRELEPWERGVYTGAIGWISAVGDVDLQIPIRTVTRSRTTTALSVGGAITWDSVPDDELAEIIAKGRAVAAALGEERWSDDR